MTQVDPRFYDEILPRLWRGGKYGNYWSNDDGEGHKVTLWHNLSENPTPKVPTVWVKRMNCYFGIHPTKGSGDSWARSKIADIALINCLYAEVDGIDTPAAEQNWIDWLQNDCPVRPSLIVFSGGGLHVYWLLREPFVLDTPEALERAIVAQKAIVARIGGDTSVHDLARVLRIPGTINHKPERAGAIVAIRFWEPDNDYTLEEIEDAIPEFITSVQETRQEAHSATSSFESLGLDDQHVLRVMFGAKNGERNRALWEGDTSVVKNGDHSIADLTLCDALAYFTGCDRDQMDRLFRQSGLMRPKWDSRPDYRDSTLNKAINTTQSVYDPTKVRDAEDAAAELAFAEQLIANHAQNQNGNNQQSEPTPTPKPPPANASGSQPATPWRIQTAGDALQPVKPLEWLIEGVLSAPSLNVVYGGPGSLKSMILAYMAACVAAGSRFLDVYPMDAMQPGDSFQAHAAPVLWIDFDNGKRRTQARLGAMLRGQSLTDETPLHYVSMPVPHLDASNHASVNGLASLVKSKGYKLVIVDNLGLITGDTEENGAGMANVMGRLRWLAEECECAVVLIHHQRKSATNGDNGGARKGETLRGHSSIEAALDLALLVERKESAESITITPTKVRDSLDFDFIGAHFTFSHVAGTKELHEARFYSTRTKSKAQQRADELEDTIIEEVRTNQGIGHQKLAELVKDTLSAKTGKSPGVNIIRGTITELAKAGKLLRNGSAAAYQYFIP